MSPIRGLTEKKRMPRIGKLHLGIKVTTNKQGKECAPYPKATDYFVYPEADAPGGEVLPQLVKEYGEKPKELPVIFALEDEESICSQYYRCYTRSRGLVCRGDGEICMRILDTKTGWLPTKDTAETTMKELPCQGRECPDYQAGQCREVMNLQFMLPKISGMGIWQIDTSSINSIRNINSCLQMIKAVYGRVAMVPLLLTLEKLEVTPPGGTKKNVHVLNIRSTDSLIQAAIKAQMSPLELVIGKAGVEQAEADVEALWPPDEQDRKLSEEEAAERMTPGEIETAQAADQWEKLESGGTEQPGTGKAPPVKPPQTKALAAPIPSQPGPEPDEKAGFITKEWLKESLKTLQDKGIKAYSNKNVLSYLNAITRGKYKDILEAVAKLDKAQAGEFVKRVQDALAKAAQGTLDMHD